MEKSDYKINQYTTIYRGYEIRELADNHFQFHKLTNGWRYNEKSLELAKNAIDSLLKADLIKILSQHCQSHEHRGCDCSVKDSYDCYGDLAEQILNKILG